MIAERERRIRVVLYKYTLQRMMNTMQRDTLAAMDALCFAAVETSNTCQTGSCAIVSLIFVQSLGSVSYHARSSVIVHVLCDAPLLQSPIVPSTATCYSLLRHFDTSSPDFE